MPEQLIISDASPLIALEDIGELGLLQKMYEQVWITDIVQAEIHANLPEWINVSTGYDVKQFDLLKLELDPPEKQVPSLWPWLKRSRRSFWMKVRGGQLPKDWA